MTLAQFLETLCFWHGGMEAEGDEICHLCGFPLKRKCLGCGERYPLDDEDICEYCQTLEEYTEEDDV